MHWNIPRNSIQTTILILLFILPILIDSQRSSWSITKSKVQNDREKTSEPPVPPKSFIFGGGAAAAEIVDDGEWIVLILRWRKVFVSGFVGVVTLLSLCYRMLMGGSSSDEEGEFKQDHTFLKKCDIGFEEIKMVLKRKKGGDRLILDGSIKGKATPGRMLAIMGPSGGGKTTLLHALAGRVLHNKRLTLSGRRYVNGRPLAEDSIIPAAFIEQHSNFFPHMTVKETLDFRIALKLGKSVPKTTRDEIAADLMEQLHLTKSANTIVGDNKIRGLSGGERKRLSIACEMVSSPSVIFLDEPTSGLDSYQATQVVETMRELADDGKTVIAVIHQPSQHVFAMFDDLLLVSEGRQMYYGEVKHARTYFEHLGIPCEREMGTAEYVIECISGTDMIIDEGEYVKSHKRLDGIASNARKDAEKIVINQTNSNSKKGLKLKRFRDPDAKGPSTNIFHQFKLLLVRSLHEVFRSKGAILIKTVQQVTIAIIYGGIYSLGNNQASIMDRFGVLSLVTIGTVNMAVSSTVRTFPKEKAIVAGEIASHMYGTLPYFISKAISEVPLIGVFSGLFGSILYPMVGLQKGRFRNFLVINCLNAMASEGAGLFIGAISPSTDFALALMPAIIVLNIIFDGKNISMENTPKALRWIPKVGLVKWAFEGLAINEFMGLTFESKGPYRGPVAKTGEEALERFNIADTTITNSLRAQANIVAGCWLLSFLGLSLTRQKYLVMNYPNGSKNGNKK